MLYRRHTPSAPLSDFIELLWLYEKPVPSHDSERVLPTGTVELVINLGDRASDGFDALVAGPHSRFFVLDTSRPISVMGAHFRPGGAFPFLALPLDELRNQHVALDALWGARAAELRERLLAARGPEARLLLLERLLTSWLRDPRAGHPVVGPALAAFEGASRRIGDVVEETGVSSRRFIRLFGDEVGLTPSPSAACVASNAP